MLNSVLFCYIYDVQIPRWLDFTGAFGTKKKCQSRIVFTVLKPPPEVWRSEAPCRLTFSTALAPRWRKHGDTGCLQTCSLTGLPRWRRHLQRWGGAQVQQPVEFPVLVEEHERHSTQGELCDLVLLRQVETLKVCRRENVLSVQSADFWESETLSAGRWDPTYFSNDHFSHFISPYAVKSINFISSQPLRTCLFNILCDKMTSGTESTPTAHSGTMVASKRRMWAII